MGSPQGGAPIRIPARQPLTYTQRTKSNPPGARTTAVSSSKRPSAARAGSARRAAGSPGTARPARLSASRPRSRPPGRAATSSRSRDRSSRRSSSSSSRPDASSGSLARDPPLADVPDLLGARPVRPPRQLLLADVPTRGATRHLARIPGPAQHTPGPRPTPLRAVPVGVRADPRQRPVVLAALPSSRAGGSAADAARDVSDVRPGVPRAARCDVLLPGMPATRRPPATVARRRPPGRRPRRSSNRGRRVAGAVVGGPRWPKLT